MASLVRAGIASLTILHYCKTRALLVLKLVCSSAAIGSGGAFALAAARALIEVEGLDASAIGMPDSRTFCLLQPRSVRHSYTLT